MQYVYNMAWRPRFLPQMCVCGVSFTVEHALCCTFGASPIYLRHNKIRDITAKMRMK